MAAALLLSADSHAQCGFADFSADKTNFCLPGVVRLKANGFPAGTTFEWNVGTGYFSGKDTMSFLVTSEGRITVSLRFTFPGNVKCVLTKKDLITARAKKKPTLIVNKPIICSGNDTVTLEDRTPGAAKRDWLIEGRFISNGPAVLKNLFSSGYGNKGVFLFSTDSSGCLNSNYFDSAVTVVQPARLNFTASKLSGCIPADISFQAKIDSFGQRIKSVNWSFPGGSPSASALRNPRILYTVSDTFDVMMKVTGQSGCIYTDTFRQALMFGDSIALNVSPLGQAACVNQVLKYSVSGGNARRVLFYTTPGTVVIDSLGPSQLWLKFKNQGDYQLAYSYSYRGCNLNKQFGKVASVNGPVAAFYPQFGYFCGLPDTITMINVTRDTTAWTNNYTWEVRDLSDQLLRKSTGKQFKFIIPFKQNYSIKLIVQGTNGCTDSQYSKNVIQYNPIKAGAQFIPSVGCPGQDMKFVSVPTGGSPKYKPKAFWTFYDKNGVSVLSNCWNRDTIFRYASAGTYSVRLKVTNIQGCTHDTLFKDTIRINKPNVTLSTSDSSICKGNYVFLQANLNGYRPGGLDAWRVKNLDSGYTIYCKGDSVRCLLDKIGRYQAEFTYQDTFRNGCLEVFKLKVILKASGVSALMEVDSLQGCQPLKSGLRAKWLQDVNFTGKTVSQTYKWVIPAGGKGSIANPSAQNTTGTFQRGWTPVKLIYSGTSGCVDSTSNVTFKAGVFASYSKSQSGNCLGTPIQFTNKSEPGATHFRWVCDSPSVVFSPSKNVENPVVTFYKRGVQKIFFIAGRYNQCFDTVKSAEYGDKPIADFFAPDSVFYCAPKLVELRNNSVDAYYLRWYFGDGDSLNTLSYPSVAHIYKKNSRIVGYTIRLVATSFFGCKDTFEKPGYIKVVGPVVDFSTRGKLYGCEPLKVGFVNNSIFFKKMIIDFGDGVTADSLTVHPYRVLNLMKNPNFYVPKYALFDSLGCSASDESKDTVWVLKGPDLKFSLNPSRGCEPLQVQFDNKSLFYNSIAWDFDNNGTIESRSEDPLYTYPRGKWSVTLMGTHPDGCADTLTLKDTITAYSTPVASFSSNTSTTCRKDPVTFFDKTSYWGVPLKSRAWNFGEAADYFDTSSAASPSYKYRTPFVKFVSLKVMDVNGCMDSITKVVYVNDTVNRPDNIINFITLNNDKDVKLVWGEYKRGDFRNYRVYFDNSAYSQKKYTTLLTDTTYSETVPDAQKRRYCYTIRVTDSCENISPYFISHCTMNCWEDTVGKKPFRIRLAWNVYEGWSKVLRYDVFRGDKGKPFTKIGSSEGDENFYIDSNLCDKEYCYYVEAVHVNGSWRSRSSSFCGRPLFLYPVKPAIVDKTSVLLNKYSYTTWFSYYWVVPGSGYVIQRSETPNSTRYYRDVSGLSYLDSLLDVNKHSYTYQVRYKDHCGNLSPVSAVANTIFLDGNATDYRANLYWNPYKYWYSGVKNYLIQMKQPDGSFQTMATVDPSVQNWRSDPLDMQGADFICFRVIAIKDSFPSAPDSSFSNEMCISPESKVFVPSAFTPNRDGKNDLFMPKSIFVYNNTGNRLYDFRMEIYNRWGEIVFTSSDSRKGWDGTYRDSPAASGVYIYRVTAVGLDGKYHSFKGSFTLLR